MRTVRTDPGFTLLEIIVALCITSIIAGVAYGTYAATTKSLAQCRARMAVEQEARTLLWRLAAEIRCAYIRPPNISDRGTVRGRDARYILSTEVTADFLGHEAAPDGELLRMLTFGGITAPRTAYPSLSTVAYRIDRSTHSLFRSQTAFLGTFPAPDNSDRWILVARGVRSIVLRYFDGKSWHGAWDSSKTGELPRAISVSVTFGTEWTKPMTFETSALLVSRQ